MKSLKKMSVVTSLLILSLLGSLGLTCIILACALPAFNNWHPISVVVFYFLVPIPRLISRMFGEDSNTHADISNFFTAGLVTSAFALPLILTRAPSQSVSGAVINSTVGGDLVPSQTLMTPEACFLTLSGNVLVFLAIAGFFQVYDKDNGDELFLLNYVNNN